jgi:CheY-like chemotaxis protein
VELFTKSLDQSDNIKQASTFDCIFMDREMPVMDGVEATRVIVAMQKERSHALRVPVPVIGVSASVECADNWRAVGMSYLLGKPFSRKDLGRVLRLIDARRRPLLDMTSPTLRSPATRKILLGSPERSPERSPQRSQENSPGTRSHGIRIPSLHRVLTIPSSPAIV